MYSRQEAAKQREAFWTAFGKYMRPILSADDTKINWINYKTGVPGVRFEMAVDDRQASVCITLVHDNPVTLESYYNQLLLLKNVLEETLGEHWL